MIYCMPKATWHKHNYRKTVMIQLLICESISWQWIVVLIGEYTCSVNKAGIESPFLYRTMTLIFIGELAVFSVPNLSCCKFGTFQGIQASLF